MQSWIFDLWFQISGSKNNPDKYQNKYQQQQQK